MVSALLLDIEKIAARLPFHLNDIDQVNATFQRWRMHGKKQDRYVIDLWTYCFVWRYFIIKFVSGSIHSDVATFDILIERAYERVQTRQDELVDETRYASWVSVICKNAFLNFRRRQPVFRSIDQNTGPVLQADVEPAAYDVGIVTEGLRQAIRRLPDYLQEVARLRLIENCSYLEIEERIGKPLATVRTYLHKAIVKIKSDTKFLTFIGWVDSG